MIPLSLKSEKWKTQFQENLTDTKNLWTKTLFKLLRSNALSPPIPCSIFRTDWDSLFIWSQCWKNNEPVTDSMYYCVKDMSHACHMVCLSPFYCNTKYYCPFRLNQTYFIYLLECVIVCLLLAPIIGLFTKVCPGFHPYTKSISGWETSSEQELKWDASFRWPFSPNSAWGSIETTTIGKTHPILNIDQYDRPEP